MNENNVILEDDDSQGAKSGCHMPSAKGDWRQVNKRRIPSQADGANGIILVGAYRIRPALRN
jgi:hypothetical protein